MLACFFKIEIFPMIEPRKNFISVLSKKKKKEFINKADCLFDVYLKGLEAFKACGAFQHSLTMLSWFDEWFPFGRESFIFY